MSEEKIIGKGTWIDKLASELLEREKKLGRSLDVINVESGLGASGIPHIGSLGDAVRAYGVKLALENLGYKSELIAYSDDLDGLRKIPEGMEKFGLEEHIGKPVSLIPDPFQLYFILNSFIAAFANSLTEYCLPVATTKSSGFFSCNIFHIA